MINVTKSYLPPYEEYEKYIKEIWKRVYLTNEGPCIKKLEERLQDYLNVDNCHFVTNGTIALQLAISSLELKESEIITTPFSFVATTNSIIWEGCKPIFVDIEPNTFCIDPTKIEEKITEKTKAIMAVHVFGYPCDIEAIEEIAEKYNLKVIYDAAHAFGAKYKGKSMLAYGDVSTCSFHATKVFHTIEGGCVISKNPDISKKVKYKKQFGFMGNDYKEVGINGKTSEFHAAMGLANLNHINEIIAKRKNICEQYDELLNGLVQKPNKSKDVEYNYAYYPILFSNEEELLTVFAELNKHEIYPRRYFYPSLNTLDFLKEKTKCPISENISSRIACLPLYPDLEDQEVDKISKIISKTLNKGRV